MSNSMEDIIYFRIILLFSFFVLFS